jgi:hypothetical protein
MDHRGDRRRGIADRLGVEAVERRNQHAQDQNTDLKTGDRMPVDQIDDIDFAGCHWRFPPLQWYPKTLLASAAPSASARNFAQAICGCERPPKPQSVPAMRFSLPTRRA